MAIHINLSILNNWCFGILGEANARQSTPAPPSPGYIDAAAYFGIPCDIPQALPARDDAGPALLPAKEPIGRRG